MKYKVLKGGLTVKAVNPHKVKHAPWHDFDRANPILPLTHQQDEGIEVSGELVWQCQTGEHGKPETYKWGTVTKEVYDNYQKYAGKKYTRQALQPITTNSKEELKEADLYWDLMSMPEIEFNKHKEIVLQVEDYHNHGKSPLPIASASIENTYRLSEVKLIATRFARQSRLMNDVTSNDTITSFDNWFKPENWQSQTTQQHLIELLEKEIARIEQLFQDPRLEHMFNAYKYSIFVLNDVKEQLTRI